MKERNKLAPDCPDCRSTAVYHRRKTSDYRCLRCGHIWPSVQPLVITDVFGVHIYGVKKVRCLKCNYGWETGTVLAYISCPSCHHSNKVLEAARYFANTCRKLKVIVPLKPLAITAPGQAL